MNSTSYRDPTLPVHDWGPFGEYEYLGVGTPYKRKMKAGIRAVNPLDRRAQQHDMWYSKTADISHSQRSQYRGLADYGAGASMLIGAFNPYLDLSIGDRALAFMAGEVLMVQGLLRLNPATMLGMTVIDWLFY